MSQVQALHDQGELSARMNSARPKVATNVGSMDGLFKKHITTKPPLHSKPPVHTKQQPVKDSVPPKSQNTKTHETGARNTSDKACESKPKPKNEPHMDMQIMVAASHINKAVDTPTTVFSLEEQENTSQNTRETNEGDNLFNNELLMDDHPSSQTLVPNMENSSPLKTSQTMEQNGDGKDRVSTQGDALEHSSNVIRLPHQVEVFTAETIDSPTMVTMSSVPQSFLENIRNPHKTSPGESTPEIEQDVDFEESDISSVAVKDKPLPSSRPSFTVFEDPVSSAPTHTESSNSILGDMKGTSFGTVMGKIVNAATPQQIPPQGVSEEVATQFSQFLGGQLLKASLNKFTVQMTPHHLGQVNIDMTIAEDGKVMAVIGADKSETLELLQKQSSTMEHIFQNSGLSTDDTSLTFTLNHGNHHPDPDKENRTPGESRDPVHTTSTYQDNERHRSHIKAPLRALDMRL